MVSFIIPTRNNLPYLQLAYRSIRKHYPKYEIVILDDNSTDGTQDWLWGLEGDVSNSESGDKDLVVHLNKGRQIGHTVLYDTGVELCRNEIFTIFHADMVCGPNYVENLMKHIKPKTVVAATRIEPPLHPPGKEKIVQNFGIYHDEFKEMEFEEFCTKAQSENVGVTTSGIFAPWAMYKDDFLAIGGHDKFFAPFPYEDSDIFQRFILAGYDVKQSRDVFVYHFTCRGHRWTKEVNKDDHFYKLCCAKNSLHFIRKWGSWIENNDESRPVINPLYDIGFYVTNCPENLLGILEPWCATIYSDANTENYIKQIQPGTPFDMKKRVRPIHEVPTNEIIVSFDGSQLTNEGLKFLTQLPKILADSGEVGVMEYDIFKINIRALIRHENTLVNTSDKNYTQLLRDMGDDQYCLNELFRVFEDTKKLS